MILAFLIIAPFLAAIIALILEPRQRSLIEGSALTAQLSSFLLSIDIVCAVAKGESVSFTSFLRIDAIGAWFLILVSGIGLAAVIHSIGYLREEVRKEIIGLRRVRQYYILFSFFLFAMLLAVSANYPILMWIAIEMTTLSTVFLISFYHQPASTEAAWKYLMLNSLGLLLGLLGVMLFFSLPEGGVTGFDWEHLRLAAGAGLSPIAAQIAFVCIFVGYGTKVGFVPMHTWLPDGHSKTPAPISALMSGVLLNVALLAILRFSSIVKATGAGDFVMHIFLFFGFFSVALSAFIMFVQKNYKRLLAYSSIDNMGLIALGFAFGGIGTFAALLQMLYHALLKSLLFLSAGNILVKYGSTKIRNVQGVFRTLPVTGTLFFGAFIALSGLPPFGMFMSKMLLLSAGFSAHPYLVSALFFLLAIVFFGFFRHISVMCFGKPAEGIVAGESNDWMLSAIILLSVAFVILSVALPAPLRAVLDQATILLNNK
ncbi:MAG: proton-conducting transporter membrane subunit [Candidatus Moraniibacteriota bacterium]